LNLSVGLHFSKWTSN